MPELIESYSHLIGENAINDNWLQEYMAERIEKRQEKKAALFTFLAEKHPEIRRIEVVYSGSCDEGYVDNICYYDDHDREMNVEDTELGEMIDDLCWLATPAGFYNNEGGQGKLRIYPASQRVMVSHGQNYMATHHEEYEVKNGEPLPSRFE